ncbi:unnamed protein product [Kuraishia capsulata CBS 1993]|uniref:Flavin-nucleotide-binding protein n=1 Tax=Kuraishia capsulata CBS 1993 TaxID=1382522 RepID=W6MRB2_9ASCO|nr:uncharacterized protein KUCA_T00005237001 [Kuraishia capsulata CBS 1993]CDK29249.1 unnamed protein product [Kuraishia capsulata CBS 1993]
MSYPQTKQNSIRVYKKRARYDYETVHGIFEDSYVVHVAFQRPGDGQLENQPMVSAMGYYLEEPCLYIHGNAASMLAKGTKEEAALPVCVTASHVDGIIFTYTPNGHALNYRSAVIHGNAQLVKDADEKDYALKQMFDQMLPGRWDNSAPVDPNAVKHVHVFRVTIESASAKVRTGMGDLGTPVPGVFAGSIPYFGSLGEPVAATPDMEIPSHISDLVETRSRKWKEYAEKVSHD